VLVELYVQYPYYIFINVQRRPPQIWIILQTQQTEKSAEG